MILRVNFAAEIRLFTVADDWYLAFAKVDWYLSCKIAAAERLIAISVQESGLSPNNDKSTRSTSKIDLRPAGSFGCGTWRRLVVTG